MGMRQEPNAAMGLARGVMGEVKWRPAGPRANVAGKQPGAG